MIREIENVFVDFPDNNCFACHPHNHYGLQLKFFADDETGEVFTRVKPKGYFAGFPGILHGGIQCALPSLEVSNISLSPEVILAPINSSSSRIFNAMIPPMRGLE